MEVKTNKEYHAMQTEIATAETNVRQAEDRLLERMEEAETHAAELKAAEGALKAGQAEVVRERQQLEAERGVDEQELTRVLGERTRIASSVTPAALGLFETVSRHRKGLAMSEAKDGLCSQCHVRLRPQVFNDVRRNERVIQCESCSRILYFLPPATASAPAS
jgi:predicted  nucleic acid-binding Zn-ribbon protein